VSPGPCARDWAIGFGGGEEAHYRRRWCALHASVRLLRTQKPARQVHDKWAWAPMSEVGPLVAAKTRGRNTARR
jgi:predicted alpha/beta hydrolase family esterase